MSDELTTEWILLFQELFEMTEIEFVRCIRPYHSVGDPILVIFSDASKDAYGAVAYAVWTLSNGTNEARLIVAKSRLAPKKQISIVRLELCGVLVAVRLKKFLFKHSRLHFKDVKFLCDSEVVRAMIQKDSYGFNSFTGLRLGEIQESENRNAFYWVSGEINVADLISRGSSPKELRVDNKWQTGTSFLKNPVFEWPLEQKMYALELLPEVIPCKRFLVNQRNSTPFVEFDTTRFSNFNSLVRTVARVLSVCSSRSFRKVKDMPNAEKVKEAWEFIVRSEQNKIMTDFEAGKFDSLGAFLEFAPGCAPWRQACAESLIASVKKCLFFAIGSQVLSLIEFQTVLFETANLLNDRPIGRHPTQPEDGFYLSPNSLLLGRTMNQSVPFIHVKTEKMARHKLVETIMNSFWKKWQQSFLPQMAHYKTWKRERKNVQAGDVVLLEDQNAIRGIWKLGIVKNVYPGRDNLERCGS